MEDWRVGRTSCITGLSLVKVGASILQVTGGSSMISSSLHFLALAGWTSWDWPVATLAEE